MNNSNTHLVSVDAGNGGTNACIATDSGYNQLYEPSVRAVATGDTLGLSKNAPIGELSYDYADWNGNRYVTGDDVVRVTRRNLERHMGANRYGNEFHQFLVALACARLGVTSGKVDLTLFAPPGMFADLKPFLVERFLQRKGRVEIALRGDEAPRKWNYSSVTVWPEGIGAAACLVLDDKGQYVASDVLSGETVVLDIGAYTLDAIQFSNGNFNPESLQHSTWENAGVHTHIREPILQEVRKLSDDFRYVTVDDIDRVIRLGSASDDYTLTVSGQEIELKPLLDKCCERYAEWVANNILDGVFGGLRGIKLVILVGGGAVLIEKYLKKWHTGKIFNRSKHPTTRDIHPVDMNAVGGLRLGLMQIKDRVGQ